MPLSNQARSAGGLTRVSGAGRVSLASLAALAITCGLAPPARAQSDAAIAESMFREGKRLSGEHKYSEACPKFAESYRLDPGLGTLLNLATCHEAEGKLASAWAEFSDAKGRAKREGDNDRAQLAEEHVRALEPKLAHVSIAVAPGASVPGLLIKFDSRELSSAALGLPIPVDPGKHSLEASAPSKLSYQQSFDAPTTPTTLTVTVPALQDAAGPTTAPAPALATGPTPVVSAAPATGAMPPAAAPTHGGSPTGLIVSGTATGLFTVGAVVTGALYASKRSDFNTANTNGDASRNDKRSSAQTMGTANLVLTGGALVSAGVLMYFIVTSGSHESPPASSARLRMEPLLSPNGAGLLVGGSL